MWSVDHGRRPRRRLRTYGEDVTVEHNTLQEPRAPPADHLGVVLPRALASITPTQIGNDFHLYDVPSEITLDALKGQGRGRAGGRVPDGHDGREATEPAIKSADRSHNHGCSRALVARPPLAHWPRKPASSSTSLLRESAPEPAGCEPELGARSREERYFALHHQPCAFRSQRSICQEIHRQTYGAARTRLRLRVRLAAAERTLLAPSAQAMI